MHMSQQTELTKEQAAKATLGRWEDSDIILRPPVNIFEDAEGIVLEADIPGVSREKLTIHVDKGRLLVEGKAFVDMPDGLEPLYADVRSTNYQFSFALSTELDTGNIQAGLKDGVLELRIPKRAELQPRKVEVRVR
jgi:HSP20 family molecular chaperone IbpA